MQLAAFPHAMLTATVATLIFGLLDYAITASLLADDDDGEGLIDWSLLFVVFVAVAVGAFVVQMWTA